MSVNKYIFSSITMNPEQRTKSPIANPYKIIYASENKDMLSSKTNEYTVLFTNDLNFYIYYIFVL